MPTPLEVELKSYAHNLVGVHLKEEYDSQIRSKWQPHINRMVDAQTEALNRHQKVLDAARKQIEKEREAAFGLVMLALSIVSGPLLSWVAGKIQYTWFPKFTEKLKDRETFIRYPGQGSKLVYIDIWHHDEVWAKVFGDLGKQIGGLGIDAVHKVTTPNSNPAQTAIQNAANSSQSSFKTNLENAMLAEADLTIKAIMSVAMTINENSNYGAECLQKLKRITPLATAPKTTEKELELMAKAMIRSDINTQREKWADEWFYYGNDPIQTAGMSESIELELWGLWVLNEKLHLVTESGVKDPLEDYGAASLTYSVGATFGKTGIPKGVLVRLAEFGVVEAQTELQKLGAIAARGVKEKLTASASARMKARQDYIDRARKRAWEIATDNTGDWAPERNPAKVANDAAEAAAKEYDRLHKNEGQISVPDDSDRPEIKVGKMVDTQGEIDALESWAKTHPPKLGAGSMTFRKRSLESIEKIYASK